MRAILLGLVMAFAAAGGAQAAKECPMNRAVVTVIDPHSQYALNEPLKRPDLVGKTFRIARYIEVHKKYRRPTSGMMSIMGYEAYELRGSKETFIIKRERIDGSPSLIILSANTNDPYVSNLKWSTPLPRKPQPFGEFDEEISLGPLSSLTLKLKRCR